MKVFQNTKLNFTKAVYVWIKKQMFYFCDTDNTPAGSRGTGGQRIWVHFC